MKDNASLASRTCRKPLHGIVAVPPLAARPISPTLPSLPRPSTPASRLISHLAPPSPHLSPPAHSCRLSPRGQGSDNEAEGGGTSRRWRDPLVGPGRRRALAEGDGCWPDPRVEGDGRWPDPHTEALEALLKGRLTNHGRQGLWRCG